MSLPNSPTLSLLESLPNEVLLHVLSFLESREIAVLQQVARNLFRRCRDPMLWRVRSFEESTTIENFYGRRHVFDPDVPSPRSGTATRKRPGGDPEYARLLENWDPFFPEESPNWYDEYIQRNAPISVNWFQQAYRDDPHAKNHYLDVTGVALYHPKAHPGSSIAVTPMADGSIYLWDVHGTRKKRGAVLGKSPVGSLFYNGKGRGRNNDMINNNVVDSVAVDSDRDMAFVAVESHLMHVDLTTMKTVSRVIFPWVIGCLSTIQPGVPLTVGTNLGIHLYDHRNRIVPKDDGNARMDQLGEDPTRIYKSLKALFDPNPLPAYAPLPQPGPLSILHLEKPGQFSSVSDEIYVTGRFSNILLYDRRKFDHMRSSIYSGASLCTLASLPFSSSSLDYECRKKGMFSLEQVEASKRPDGGRTIIAGGEYNSKGSLELYDLLPRTGLWTSNHQQPVAGELQRGAMKNRQTASTSKVLSVATHGSRIVLSDASGFVKWFERDGFTEVRRWKVGHSFMGASQSLFASMPGLDDVARKMLVTCGPTGRKKYDGDDAGVNQGDLLFWTGEKLGLLTFSARPGSVPEDFEKDHDNDDDGDDDGDDDEGTGGVRRKKAKTSEELELQEKERMHSQQMREALQRHADEVRFVQELGL